MMKLAKELWPHNRSISGVGLRDSLGILKREVNDLEIKKFESGSSVFDWTVPPEWNVREAYILTPEGEKICDFSKNNLHLVGYSESFEGVLSLRDLQAHLHSLPDQPEAIPYVTSYYFRTWGFCLSELDRGNLVDGDYRVVISSDFSDTSLDYGELLIKGTSSREIFFSTYLCHPSMANNELSGPVLAVELAKYLEKLDNFYSYRFVFLPETIGSIAYMAENLARMKSDILAGFVLTCVGDERQYSYLPSRNGGTVSDSLALGTFRDLNLSPVLYEWNDRGSDERQYCAPGADLPVCSVMRSKYGEYPEYHTSLDTLGGVVTAQGLQGSFDFFTTLIRKLERQRYPRMLVIGEPQLGKRGMYPNTSKKGAYGDVEGFMDLISQLDGTIEIESAIDKSGLERTSANEFLSRLHEQELLEW